MATSIYWEIAILTLVSVVLYLKTLTNGHTLDDHPGIEWNIVVLGRKTPFWSAVLTTDFWGQDLKLAHSHGSFRPLVTGLYRLEALVTAYFTEKPSNETAPHPGLLHAVNIFFHALSTIALYWFIGAFVAPGITCSLDLSIFNKIFKLRNNKAIDLSTAFVAAILFALHPIHAEAVCGGVGQAEVTCTFFMLLALCVYGKIMTKSSNIATKILLNLALTVLAFLSAASKEQGFMLLPMCILFELTLIASKKFSLWRIFISVAITLILVAIRLTLFGAPKIALFLWFDNPASFQPFPIRHLTYAYLPTFCVWLMVYPWTLCADWGDGAIALVKSFADMRLLPALIAFGFLVAKLYETLQPLLTATWNYYLNRRPAQTKSSYDRSTDSLFLMAFILYAVTFLPSSNFLGAVGFVVAERVLYAPSAGFCLLIATGFHRAQSFHRFNNKIGNSLLSLLFLLTCLCFATRTVQRTFDWESDFKLSYSGLKVSDSNARVLINVGAYVRETQSNCHKALAYFDKAIRLNPKMAKAHFNRARCLRTLIEAGLAESSSPADQSKKSRKKKRKEPEPTLEELARSCDHSLHHCIAVGKWNIPPNGFIPNHLVECYLDLINLMTMHGGLYLGAKAQSQEVAERAIELSNTALKMRPDFARVYVTRGNLMMAMARFNEAKAELKKARKLDPNNVEIIRAIGWIIAEKEKKDAEAVKFYTDALTLQPGYEGAAIELSKIVLRSKLVDHYPIAAFRLSQLNPSPNLKQEVSALTNELALQIHRNRGGV